jgi:hypothetical protein
MRQRLFSAASSLHVRRICGAMKARRYTIAKFANAITFLLSLEEF